MLTALVMILVVAAAWIGGSRLETATRNQVADKMDTILYISHRAVEAWSEGHRQTAALWADTPAVTSYAQALLETEPNRDALLAVPAQTGLRELLEPVLASRGYDGYFVIGRDGLSLSSTRDANTGTPNLMLSQPGVLERIWEGETAMGTPLVSDVPLLTDDGVLLPDQATMFSGAPIRGAGGEIVAALMFRIDPTQDFTAILQRGRVGESGETYAFDGEGRLISESRFDDQLRSIGLVDADQRAILNVTIRDPGVNLLAGEDGALPVAERPLTLMASEAVAMKTGRDLDGYRDYRGVEVVGAWLWDENLGFGITSEIDVAEAYAVLRSNRLGIIGTAVFIELLIAVIVAVFIRHKRGLVESGERLGDLNRQLLSYSERLARSNRELEDFASVAAHDLQEPLRKVQAFGDRLVAESESDLSEKGRDYLERMQKASGRMRVLIDDLLTYSRVATKAQPFELVDLADVMAEVQRTCETLIEETGGRLEVAELPVIEADATQMEQLLQNLITNAFKFHRPDVPPVVEVSGEVTGVHRQDDVKQLRLTITDNGIGFDQKYLEKIFTMFERLHGRDEYSGTGVGLAVCRRIVDRHNGQITAQGNPGEGSTFIVTLPIQQPVESQLPG